MAGDNIDTVVTKIQQEARQRGVTNVTSVTKRRSTERAGQDQAVGAPAGPANDMKENSIRCRGCAGSSGRLTVHPLPGSETRRCGAAGARCGGEGGTILKDDAL